MSVQPRQYQLAAIERLRALIVAGVMRILFVLPTGGGKTVCFAYIAASAIALGSRILIVAHRRELIDQAYAKLLAAGIPEREVGVIMAGDKRRRPGARIQVASIDTLRNRPLPEADIVIVDEAHRALAEGYKMLQRHYTKAVHLGFTATPQRGDQRGLREEYDEMVVAAPVSQLIADGFLAAPRGFSVPEDQLPDVRRVKTTAGDYNVKQLGDACNQGALVGNIVEHYEQRAEERRTVGFAVTVEHSKEIVRRFVQRGHKAEHLDGETPAEERRDILARLDAGDTRIVVNVGVLCEGWDQPSCKCLILARPTQSLSLCLQMAGRILRPWNGVEPIILDHAGNLRMHGMPQWDQQWSLDAPQKRRRGANENDCAKMCPECFAVVALGVRICPECGAELPWREQNFAEQDGNLEEVLGASVTQLAKWDAFVEEWRTENAKRMVSGGVPRKAGWLFFGWKQRYHFPPPRGVKRVQNTPEELARIAAHEARKGGAAPVISSAPRLVEMRAPAPRVPSIAPAQPRDYMIEPGGQRVAVSW